MNIAVFSSHNGSDLQAIIDACNNGSINAKVCAVFSNNSDSRALIRASEAGIDNYHVSTIVYGSNEAMNAFILRQLDHHKTDMIFLAGYLKKLGVEILKKYHNRVFNIHPALLPKYGGQGMFGMNVHKAVIASKDAVSGVTIHRVTEEYDAGEIVAQATVEVSSWETAESLAEKVLNREHQFIVEVIKEIIEGRIPLGDSATLATGGI